MKIRKVKRTKSKEMVQNLKVSTSGAVHLWTEYNSEKKDESNNGVPSSSGHTLFTDICPPPKRRIFGENLIFSQYNYLAGTYYVK